MLRWKFCLRAVCQQGKGRKKLPPHLPVCRMKDQPKGPWNNYLTQFSILCRLLPFVRSRQYWCVYLSLIFRSVLQGDLASPKFLTFYARLFGRRLFFGWTLFVAERLFFVTGVATGALARARIIRLIYICMYIKGDPQLKKLPGINQWLHCPVGYQK